MRPALNECVKKAGNFLLHPIVIAIFLTAAITLLFLPVYTKYLLEIKDHFRKNGTSLIFMYEDLDGNGFSDVIQTARYSNGINCLTVFFEPAVFFQEWDFKGHFEFAKNSYILTGDYDSNNSKEIYVFTLSNDSVLLHNITDIFNKKPVYQTRFITQVAKLVDSAHVEIVKGEMEDLNGDGFKELIFAVNAGFSLYPRAVFAYDIKHDSLMRSPRWNYFTGQIKQADINGDKHREIIVNGYATTNFLHKRVDYTDEHCWLMVLDQNLQFLFPPVPFSDSGYSGLSVLPVINKKGYSDLYALYLPPLLSKKPAVLLRFDSKGKVLRSKELPGYKFFKTTSSEIIRTKKRPLIGILDNEGTGVLYDTNFNLVKEFILPFSYYAMSNLDIDEDGMTESVVLDPARGELLIYHEDLKDLVSVPMNLDGGEIQVFLKKAGGYKPLLAVCNGLNIFLVSYERNPLYLLRWIIYAGVFASIIIFIYVIRMITRNQLRKRYETVKKINELQLMVVRNQMDPHFTMNAINSVIGAVHREEKESAAQSLVHFSRMYRALVLSGDRTDRTLEEEIEFSRNYLELERFRFSNKFEYRIDIDPEVNMECNVPKMIIQSPVENAVKHGLLPKQDSGLLTISIRKQGTLLVIEVEDNGVGRKKATEDNNAGTGRGLKIMDEFLTLYQSMHPIHISWKIIDLTSPGGDPAGTKVVMKLDFKS